MTVFTQGGIPSGIRPIVALVAAHGTPPSPIIGAMTCHARRRVIPRVLAMATRGAVIVRVSARSFVAGIATHPGPITLVIRSVTIDTLVDAADDDV